MQIVVARFSNASILRLSKQPKHHTTMSTTISVKPITKIINLALNGFHGYQTHNVRATFTPRPGADSELTPFGYSESEVAGYDVTITESAASKFACKNSDCQCGESVPTAFVCDQYDFDHGDITINGKFPQR